MNTAEITIADVAKQAGVSVSTVSRILNNKPDVAERTRLHVQQTIDEMGYRPHSQARRLAAGSSRTIAFLHPIEYLFSEYTMAETDFIVGASFAAAEEAFMFNLVTVPVTEDSLLDLFRSAQVDGVILMEIHLDDWRVNLLREANLPFAMIGHCHDNEGLTYIDIDFETALNDAMDHLVELGHRDIGFVTHSSVVRERQYGPAVRSHLGYEAACRRHGLTMHYRESDADIPNVHEATIALLDQNPDLTAIVTTAGAAVAGVLSALRDRKLRVPEELSVISFISKRFTQLIVPALTAVDMPGYTMGYRGAKMLIDKLNDPGRDPEQVLLAPELIIRESTASPRNL